VVGGDTDFKFDRQIDRSKS